MKKQRIVIAFGGNAILQKGQEGTVYEQFANTRLAIDRIMGLIRDGHEIVITHGNGPQVGFILRRSELARGELHEVPLDSCGADTQGAIGYQIQQALYNVTKDWEQRPGIATVVTQVLVDRDDPSFQKPSKPIGSFLSETEARAHQERDGWNVVEDAGRGWRRVVASPRPQQILELEAIRQLLAAGLVVVAVGGGGIPVALDADGTLRGADAVIDKDLATSLLARELQADTLVISTAVEKVYLDYRKPTQRALDRITLLEAKQHLAAGHFAAGSMKPKIEAVIEFLEAGGQEALITDPAHLVDAFEGRTGTWIVAR